MKIWFLSLLSLACSSSTVSDNHARVVSIGDSWMNLQIYDQSYHVLPLEPGIQVCDTLHVLISTRDDVLEIEIERGSGE